LSVFVCRPASMFMPLIALRLSSFFGRASIA
jgi:hypothetical protein